MRYIMKGGVWKNSEDQILKAAIMKYGLNQWSRISSLLQRKSAKQCKQRWYEWLDPSIKKTEWTRVEDQKLLQISRVFPSQWRTVAPFVGRTPTQCYERYQKLLDVAQGKSIKEAEQLRKLRPGEIDPNPETKPARLDPIDMDEDEKEMLAQVRVRLANTKGKKAKRKQREKIIEEARRLAQLQKIRQLEMAGVQNIPTAKEIKRLRQKKDINYNKEIPFKRQVPQFVYKVEKDQTPKGLAFAQTITMQTLEGKRRDVEEQLQRKLDKRRLNKLKEHNLKAVLKLKRNFQKPAAMPIQLPQPQLNEKDLENLKKYNITTPLNSELISQTPLGMTPENRILYAARVNMSLNHQGKMSEDQQEIQGLKQAQQIEGLKRLKLFEKGQTKQLRSIDRVISERAKTPLNEWEADSHNKLASLFKGLSKPENIVEFQIPEVEEEEQDQQKLDAQERQRQERKRQQLLQELNRQQQTQVINMKLPRSLYIGSKLNPCLNGQSNELVENEMLSLMYSDALDYPIEGTQFPSQEIMYRQTLSLQQIREARKLVEEETLKINRIGKGQIMKDMQGFNLHYQLNFDTKECLLTDQKTQSMIQEEREESYRLNYDTYKNIVHRSNQTALKAKKYLGGYLKIIKARLNAINQKKKQLESLRIQKDALGRLVMRDKAAMALRLDDLNYYYSLVYNAL